MEKKGRVRKDGLNKKVQGEERNSAMEQRWRKA